MHEVLVNRLGGLSLPRKSVVRLPDRPDMTLDVYRGRNTTIQQSVFFTQINMIHVPMVLFIETVFRDAMYRGRNIVKKNEPLEYSNRSLSKMERAGRAVYRSR